MKEHLFDVYMGPLKIGVFRVHNLDADGQWVADKHEVHIHTGLTGKRFQEVLIHELLHAASDFCHAELEENQVTPISMFLCQAMEKFWK